MKKIPERFLWADEMIRPKTTDHILEIGCGTGILTEILAETTVKGKITCIDKSKSAISTAINKNKEKVDSGQIEFHQCRFMECHLPLASFDKIVAFNVNIFLKPGEGELQKVKLLLKKNGQLFVFYQFPYQVSIAAADPITHHLELSGFRVEKKLLKKLHPVSAICISAFR